jgi:Ty3 transposon capsid-like protein/Zinc knuckle
VALRVVRTFKGPPFSGEGVLVIEEFIYQLTNQIVMQGIAEDEQRMMVLISRVTGAAKTWLRQKRTVYPDEDFSIVIRVLGDRYKDRLKYERVFQKLNTIRQEKKTVREFNQEFTNVLMDLDPRPLEEMLIWYYKTAVRWKFAEALGERKPVSVEKTMIRLEEKEQEKKAHEVVYEGQRVESKIVEVTTPMNIGKRRVTCEYCGKPNHTASMCKKKVIEIKIASRKKLVKERRCFKCGKQGHIARMCNVKKVAVVSEENKNTSTYFSLKKKERKKKSKESSQV